MELVDTKYVDVGAEGKGLVIKLGAPGALVEGEIKISIIAALKELAKNTDNKLDDSIIAIVEAAFA
jgi:hypothetical protein